MEAGTSMTTSWFAFQAESADLLDALERDLLELERVGRRRVIQFRGDGAPRSLPDGTRRVW